MHTSQQFRCLGDWCGPLQSFSHNILFYINKIHVFLDYQKIFFFMGGFIDLFRIKYMTYASFF